MGVDPLRIFGSGALLAAVPDGASDDAVAALDAEGIAASEIGVGRAADGEDGSDDDASGSENEDRGKDAGAAESERADAGVRLDGELVRDAIRDDLYALWE